MYPIGNRAVDDTTSGDERIVYEAFILTDTALMTASVTSSETTTGSISREMRRQTHTPQSGQSDATLGR